jgi:cytoskeleton protein RodZ
MSEPKDKKKKKQAEAHAPLRTDNPRVGDLLRHEREAQGMSLEDVCGSINIRTVQLRAIEDSNIDQLPGMIYATGFVRSYANFLKMDSAALVKKFKEEHAGFVDHKPELHFPEPIAEGNIPSSLVIGIGALCAVVILVGWAFFNGDNSQAPEIPEAPVVTADSGLSASTSFFGSDETSAAEAPVEPLAETAEGTTAFQPLTAQTTDVPSAMAPVAPETAVAGGEQVPAPEAAAAAPVETPVVAVTEPAAEENPVLKTEEPPPVIEVKAPKTRVTLEASQSSWLQITDANQKVIFKKVMKPGEKYSVPDQPGLSLITSNAGGLSVYVDGKKVNPIGGQGDIVRGVPLDPKSLQSRRNKSQYN